MSRHLQMSIQGLQPNGQIAHIMQQRIVEVFPAQARATWDQVGLFLQKESVYGTLLLKTRRWSTSLLNVLDCHSMLLSWSSRGSVLTYLGEDE